MGIDRVIYVNQEDLLKKQMEEFSDNLAIFEYKLEPKDNNRYTIVPSTASEHLLRSYKKEVAALEIALHEITTSYQALKNHNKSNPTLEQLLQKLTDRFNAAKEKAIAQEISNENIAEIRRQRKQTSEQKPNQSLFFKSAAVMVTTIAVGFGLYALSNH